MWRPLLWALLVASGGCIEVRATRLLDTGCHARLAVPTGVLYDYDYVYDEGGTPWLCMAACKGDVNAVCSALAGGADAHAATCRNGLTPLDLARGATARVLSGEEACA